MPIDLDRCRFSLLDIAFSSHISTSFGRVTRTRVLHRDWGLQGARADDSAKAKEVRHVVKGQTPDHKERVRELAERIGIALGARALWTLIEWLFDHDRIVF